MKSSQENLIIFKNLECCLLCKYCASSHATSPLSYSGLPCHLTMLQLHALFPKLKASISTYQPAWIIATLIMFVINQTVSKSVKISESKEYLSVQITHLTGTLPYSVRQNGGEGPVQRWRPVNVAADSALRHLAFLYISMVQPITGGLGETGTRPEQGEAWI